MSNVLYPGINVRSIANELYRALHLDCAKAARQTDGQYNDARVPITLDDLARHLTGETTLAFTVVGRDGAYFAGIDIDARFTELLPVARATAYESGGAELVDAMFATSGSDDGRGKIIVAFAQPMPVLGAQRLIQRVAEAVRGSALVLGVPSNKISVYPQDGEGGLLRVLGRNPKRDGPLEVAFSLDGAPGLAHLRPLKREALTRIVALLRDGAARWAQHFLDEPWRASKGTDRHYGRMVALGREAIRIRGPVAGRRLYDSWLDRIKANSPELSQPSQNNKDRRNVLDHGRERAWRWACMHPTSWEPLDLTARKDVPPGVRSVCDDLASFVREHGLRPSCFGIDYERIAALHGCSKSTAYGRVQQAAAVGVMVVHDRGLPRKAGAKGACVLLGLVCRGQTAEQVRAQAATSDLIRQRTELKAARAAKQTRDGHKAAESARGIIVAFPEPRTPLRPSARAPRDDMLRGLVDRLFLDRASDAVFARQHLLRRARFPPTRPEDCRYLCGHAGERCQRCGASWSKHYPRPADSRKSCLG